MLALILDAQDGKAINILPGDTRLVSTINLVRWFSKILAALLLVRKSAKGYGRIRVVVHLMTIKCTRMFTIVSYELVDEDAR